MGLSFRSRVLRSVLVLLASFDSYLIFAAPAQDGQGAKVQASGLTLKANVRRVVVDVVVTDRNGQPVRGLTSDQFTVAENGLPQRVLSLDSYDFAGPPSFVPPKVPAMPVNTFVNMPAAPERGPLYLILYDMVNMEREDQMFARPQLLKFLRGKPEGARFAILALSDGPHLVQGFTDDREKLLAAVDAKGTTHVPSIFLSGISYGKGSTLASIMVFRQISRYLEGMPGRKNVLWFSGNFPLTLFSDSDSANAGVADYRQEAKEVINTLAHDQIAIYPVDVRGVAIHDDYASLGGGPDNGAASKHENDGGPTANRGGLGARLSEVKGGMAIPGASMLGRSYMIQDEVARETGGRASKGNDLANELQQVTATGGSYYTLTYSPSDRNYDGKIRRISVEIAKPGCQTAYRRSYFAQAPESTQQERSGGVNADEGRDADLAGTLSPAFNASMQHGAPIAHELVVAAHIVPTGSPAMATPEQMAQLTQQPAFAHTLRHDRAASPSPPIRIQKMTIEYKVLAAQ